MKKYEAIFILDPRKNEDDGKSFASQFEEKIQNWGGKVTLSNNMGRKTFAREIKKRKVGIYYNFLFEVDPDKEALIREDYRLDERILRLLVIIDDRPAKIVTLPDLPPQGLNPIQTASIADDKIESQKTVE